MESKKPEGEVKPKFVNERTALIQEATEGLLLTDPNLRRIGQSNVIAVTSPDPKRVHLITGGGSGHEPSHAGFVGKGLLSAAVCGNVFSSPTALDVYKGIKAVAGEAGVLVIIKNYQGDIINFELAASRARSDGIKVATLHVADDITFCTEEDKDTWRSSARGLCGTVVLYKILGALAEKGLSLEELSKIGQNVIGSLFTFGASLTSVAPPFQPEISPIKSEEIEIGLGIHGERGAKTIPFEGSSKTMEIVLAKFNEVLTLKNKEFAVVLNNLGSTSELEMGVLAMDLITQLSKKFEAKIARFLSGTLMTSIDMKGFSVTLLDVSRSDSKEILEGLDQDSFSGRLSFKKDIALEGKREDLSGQELTKVATGKKYEGPWHNFLARLLGNLQSNEKLLNELDAAVGDGDLGANVALCSAEILKVLPQLNFDENMASSLRGIGDVVSSHFGGTSGALYSIFLLEGSLALKESGNKPTDWVQALLKGVEGIRRVGGANEGDRTCLDVLIPVQREAEKIAKGESSRKLKEAAEEAEEKSRGLKAKKGRSRYLAGKEIGLKDPGCYLAKLWLSEISDFSGF